MCMNGLRFKFLTRDKFSSTVTVYIFFDNDDDDGENRQQQQRKNVCVML